MVTMQGSLKERVDDLMDYLPPIASQANMDRWLAASGFAFNPFAFLDANADPRIFAYLVGHGAFATMWGPWPAIAYAPPGGGKTALRLQVTESCWSGPDRGYPFPIAYLPLAPAGQLPGALDEHLASILESAAESLLQAFKRRPHWWHELGNAACREMRGLLDIDLPCSLEHQLAETEDRLSSPAQVPAHLENSEVRLQLASWRDVLQQLATTPAGRPPSDPSRRLQVYADLVLHDLGMSAVYLLVDGIDSFPETADDARASTALLEPLMSQVKTWNDRGVFLKGFFPAELSGLVTHMAPSTTPRFREVSVAWSPQLLAEVLRQRIYVATAGQFGSLDALAAPGLRDVETRIARAVRPLPREALVLVTALIWEHLRHSSSTGQLDEADMQAAIHWYRSVDVLGSQLQWTNQ